MSAFHLKSVHKVSCSNLTTYDDDHHGDHSLPSTGVAGPPTIPVIRGPPKNERCSASESDKEQKQGDESGWQLGRQHEADTVYGSEARRPAGTKRSRFSWSSNLKGSYLVVK
jgi:hypothetical protein